MILICPRLCSLENFKSSILGQWALRCPQAGQLGFFLVKVAGDMGFPSQARLVPYYMVPTASDSPCLPTPASQPLKTLGFSKCNSMFPSTSCSFYLYLLPGTAPTPTVPISVFRYPLYPSTNCSGVGSRDLCRLSHPPRGADCSF